MEGLQRSVVSFRRQGSSGLVWDDKFLSGELTKPRDDDHESGDTRGTSDLVQPPNATLERSRSAGDQGGRRYHRTARDSPVADPPSPRVSACGFCGAFGKAPRGDGKSKRRAKHGNKRLR